MSNLLFLVLVVAALLPGDAANLSSNDASLADHLNIEDPTADLRPLRLRAGKLKTNFSAEAPTPNPKAAADEHFLTVGPYVLPLPRLYHEVVPTDPPRDTAIAHDEQPLPLTVTGVTDPPPQSGHAKAIWPGEEYNNFYNFHASDEDDKYRELWMMPDPPPLLGFAEKQFDKSEASYVEKKYFIEVNAACKLEASKYCVLNTGGSYNAPTTTDKDMRHCIENLDPSCKISIDGYWNFTRPHAPDLCLSHSVGIRLPSPGAITPRRDCVYSNITLWNVNIKWKMYESEDDLNKIGRGETYCQDWVGPHWKACRAGIEWGKALPTPDCRRRDYRNSVLMKPGEWVYKNTGYYWDGWRHRADDKLQFESAQYWGGHMNLILNVEGTRYDRDADGFIFSDEPTVFPTNFDWGLYGLEIPFTCSTNGQKGLLSKAEPYRDVAADSRQKV